mmetsp:Transcript_4043/g.12145  ORF Transcript_4043/g.12145 Transcript_4043/m.12145 type:complete len:264 (+) Transcript_4043:913-1704(+)
MVTVSKNISDLVLKPSSLAPAAMMLARPWTLLAICLRPSGPWYTAYMAAMLASRAWAVQMFEVAFSLLMCCSRVCMAMRSAGFPCWSMLVPMTLPGMILLYLSAVARKAAWGPPYPMGTPNLWEDPMAMSAPNSPGGVSMVKASRSVAMTTLAFTPWAASMTEPYSFRDPSVAGDCRSTPHTSLPLKSKSASEDTMHSRPSPSALEAHTAMVWGWHLSETRNFGFLPLAMALHMVMASAAAVDSSSSEEFAKGNPVRSEIMVW